MNEPGEGRILPLHDYRLQANRVEDARLPPELMLICTRCGLELGRWPTGMTSGQVVIQTIRLHEDSAHETGQAAAYDRAGWDPRRRQEGP